MNASSIEALRAALADRYEIDREIGSGGMATVYLARDVRHRREVALKVLKPELGAVLGTERFLSEITVTANLQHPNLLPLFDSGEAAGLLYYVMPFVRGESLRAKLDRERQLSVEESVRIAVSCASGLQCAHEHGVIHRDLKPENILIQSGQPVIADFGIALAVSNAGGARVTQTGLSLGTPHYMSPEQATADREIDARSDIYSLGAVTYEMLSGQPPHTGATAQAIIAKLITNEPESLSSLRSTVPMNVVCAVEKALSKLPADRFASASDFAAALQNPGFTTAARYGRGVSGNPAAVRKWRTIAAAASAVSALLLGITLWSLFKPEPPRQVVRYDMNMDSARTLIGGMSRIAISPDGRRLALTVVPGPSLYVRDRNQIEGRVIPGIEQAYAPFFSDDGSRIGYVHPPAGLSVVSLDGGPPVQWSDSILGSPAAFAPDGSVLATSVRVHRIVRLREPGKPLVPVTVVDSAAGEARHLVPEALPDGQRFLFTVHYTGASGDRPASIAIGDARTRKHRILVNGIAARYSPSGHLIYATNEGILMVAPFDADKGELTGPATSVAEGLRVSGPQRFTDFGVSRNGTLVYARGSAGLDREIVWVTRDGKTTLVDSTWRGGFGAPSLSPDGRLLAVSNLTGTRTDVWVKVLDKGPAHKLTFDGTSSTYPVWTPDGRNITYSGNARGSQDIWTKRADGSGTPLLQADMQKEIAEAAWSPDGKWLLLRTNTNTEGAGDIYAMRPGFDSVPIPLLTSKYSEVGMSVSPDGRFMSYVSDESGKQEVYVVPFPAVSSAKWAISNGRAREPTWSRSGRELYYRSDTHLLSVAVTTTPTFLAGETKVLFPSNAFATTINHRAYDVTPDGRRFIFLRAPGGITPTNLVFVENWFEELKRK